MANTWKKLNEETVFNGFRKILSREYELPDGSKKVFQLFSERSSVDVLALTPEHKVILVRQFRPGSETILTELPSGYIDENETPEEAAKRELSEETGYEGKLVYVGQCRPSSYGTLVRYIFVATDCIKKREVLFDNTEFIDLIEMQLKDFRNHLQTSPFCNVAGAYLGLDFLGLLK